MILLQITNINITLSKTKISSGDFWSKAIELFDLRAENEKKTKLTQFSELPLILSNMIRIMRRLSPKILI